VNFSKPRRLCGYSLLAFTNEENAQWPREDPHVFVILRWLRDGGAVRLREHIKKAC